MWPYCISNPCMAAPRVYSLTVACLCFLCAGAVLLQRFTSGSAAAWIPTSWAPSHPSTCPPAWQPEANETVTSTESYQRCLARHGRDLHTGYSLKCAYICISFLWGSMHAVHVLGIGRYISGRTKPRDSF